MAWRFNDHEAVFIQIADRIRAEILSGAYQPGQQIPPVRQLASEAAVNPNTMQKALALLEEQGLVHSHGTVGRFITDDTAVIDSALEQVRRNTVRAWLSQAKELGISTEELIQYIKKEGEA